MTSKEAFAALSMAFKAISEAIWPGDRVTVYGEPRTYVRRWACGFHVVETDEGGQQLAPPDAVVRRR